MAEKLVRRGQINTVAPGRLVRIVDESTQRLPTPFFLSLLPASSPDLVSWVQMGCIFLDGKSAGYSWFFHGLRFEWPFLLARVQFPIIGVDFLRHFKWILRRAAWLTLSPLSYYLQYPACGASQNQPTPRRWPMSHLQGKPQRRCTLRGWPSPLILVEARAASPTGL